ncbi:MAG: phosphoribosylanthranilate isomerase [Pseudomonadales bacterium]|jgi:phosphoribosylanthranilate isomerase|nr:phosphoribosylanthranilate isomerase [Pseudomonadales bacterium]MDP6473146.1 phosphoribosylanthranilate isomerase [Pseudomonadales bacterium]MDP6826097.1 phosphoribosylanthranilate isomerase [Pseudomonadales bacterium]MDP6970370.1 phosphoribosylanthranilate isomerase [Pseudomonadales bacterium]
MAVQIKICGITRGEDVDALLRLGVDAMGLNFYHASARNVGVARAAELAARAGSGIRKIGVFVNEPADGVRAVAAEVSLDALQFHGEEEDDYCASFGLPYLKALRIRSAVSVCELVSRFPSAEGFLLDAYHPNARGGTGITFDWGLWPRDADEIDATFWLAGGLTPDNVGRAIVATQPSGVDVSGGVEGARAGEKECERMQRFVDEVRGVGLG